MTSLTGYEPHRTRCLADRKAHERHWLLVQWCEPIYWSTP